MLPATVLNLTYQHTCVTNWWNLPSLVPCQNLDRQNMDCQQSSKWEKISAGMVALSSSFSSPQASTILATNISDQLPKSQKTACKHTGMSFQRKEVSVCFPSSQRSTGVPYRSIPSHFKPWPSKPGLSKLAHYTNPNPNSNPYLTLPLFLTLFLTLISNPNPIPIPSPNPK